MMIGRVGIISAGRHARSVFARLLFSCIDQTLTMLQHHDLYGSTALFDVEIDKLMPHMAGGWAHYVKLTQEIS